jgi:hypothetical protein
MGVCFSNGEAFALRSPSRLYYVYRRPPSRYVLECTVEK